MHLLVIFIYINLHANIFKFNKNIFRKVFKYFITLEYCGDSMC